MRPRAQKIAKSNIAQPGLRSTFINFSITSIITRLVILISAIGACLYLGGLFESNYSEILAGTFGGLIFGSLLVLGLIEYSMGHTAARIKESSETQDDSTHIAQRTGISSLDTIVESYSNNLSRFADTLSMVGEEAESLIERYEVLTENLAASVVIRDAHGKITYCSPYTEVLTGASLSEIYSASEDFFISNSNEEDRDKFSRALSVSSLGEAFQFRYRFTHKTGIEMWAEMRTVPVFSEENKFLGTLSITLDITGTMRYQQQVEERNKDLQEFSYMISHDLKAPIFTIKGMLGVLKEDHKEILTGETGEIMMHIEKAADRLSALVNAVLEYSKVTTKQTNLESINTRSLLEEVIAEFSSQLKDCGGTISLHDNLPNITGDRLMVYQIFSNLIGNAIKYRHPDRALQIQINSPEDVRNSAVIKIIDNGSGIAKDKLESIFRPFQRAHTGSVEGSGIGLACVKKLLQKLNGSVNVDSEQSSGSTFTIKLPISRSLHGETHG
jgi:PAS domain S-box-containing protein